MFAYAQQTSQKKNAAPSFVFLEMKACSRWATLWNYSIMLENLEYSGNYSAKEDDKACWVRNIVIGHQRWFPLAKKA